MEQKNEKSKKPRNGFGLRLTMAIIMYFIAIGLAVQIVNIGRSDINSIMIFCILDAVFWLLAILQTVFAVAGKKHLWADIGSIVLGAFFCIYIIGIFGLIGGLKSEPYRANRAERKAKRDAEEAKRREEAVANKESTFTGGAFMNALIEWVSALVTVLTLGICYPFMACRKLKWKASHTFVDGRQQYFDGNGLQFMGRYMLLLFLSAITFGIYYVLCAKVAIEKWQTRHTHFVDGKEDAAEEKVSHFDGRWYQLLGVNLLCNFVTIITLSFGQYWAHCYKERWYCKHRIIDGERLTFDGKAMQYFGKRLLWNFLTVITLGIFVFWLKVKTLKWTVSHTHITERELSAEGGIPMQNQSVTA